MKRFQNQSRDGWMRQRRCTVRVLPVMGLLLLPLLMWNLSVAKGPAPLDDVKGESRGTLTPISQTRTIYAHADGYSSARCDVTETDAALDFSPYDNTVEATCIEALGRAEQQSTIAPTSLYATGFAFGYGCDGGGCHYTGDAESVFEIVFSSPTTKWCTISGEISTLFNIGGFCSAEVRLTGPGDSVLFQRQLADEIDTLIFSEDVLLEAGVQYTLRAAADMHAVEGSFEGQYTVDLDTSGSTPTNDAGASAITSPPAEIVAGVTQIGATIANFGTANQDVPVHCEVLQPDFTYLDEGFDVAVPPPGWSQEQAGEWQQQYSAQAHGGSPEAVLDHLNIVGDYANIDSAPVNTTGATHLILEFAHYIKVYYEGLMPRVLVKSDTLEPWSDVTPWVLPLPDQHVGPERVRIDISHAVGPATQVRFEYTGEAWLLREWYLDDVKLFDLDVAHTADELVSVPALSEVNMQFASAWSALKGWYVLNVTTQLPGDEDPENDQMTEQVTVTYTILCLQDLVPPSGVEQQDLNAVLNRWGDPACLPGGLDYPCPEDLVLPVGVEQQDLNAVLNRWGDPGCVR